MSEPEMVCAKCGSDHIDVFFTATGSGAAAIGVDDKGKPYVAHVDDEQYDDHDHESYGCAKCKANWWPLEKGVTLKALAGIDFNVGDVVILPDGLRATVATVDRETNTFTVERWHETFKAGEASPLAPAPIVV
jgi:hypothetical protein